MRPPVRLLQPLEAPSLQLSKSLYVCSSCRHNVLPACSLKYAHARRHASGQTPLTERLRQRIWGTSQPPGLEDPYGGEGIISKAWKKRKGEHTGEQERVQEVEEEEEAAAVAAAAEAARVGSRKAQREPTTEFTPAKTAEGLQIIGHRRKWTDLGRKEGDQYSP
jgi:hypothetical protein